MNDFLTWGLIERNGTRFDYSTIGFLYVSLRNDTLRFDPGIDFAPPIAHDMSIHNWVWVTNNSESKMFINPLWKCLIKSAY